MNGSYSINHVSESHDTGIADPKRLFSGAKITVSEWWNRLRISHNSGFGVFKVMATNNIRKGDQVEDEDER